MERREGISRDTGNLARVGPLNYLRAARARLRETSAALGRLWARAETAYRSEPRLRGLVERAREELAELAAPLTGAAPRRPAKRRPPTRPGLVHRPTARLRRTHRLEPRLEAELFQRDPSVREIMETLSDGLVVADTTDRIVYANGRVAHLLGCRAEEIEGRLLRDLLAPRSRWAYRAQSAEWLQGKTSRQELTFQRSSDHVLQAVMSARPLLDARGHVTGCFAILTAATEGRKEAQTLLGKGEIELRNVVEHSTNLLYVRTPEDVLTYVSPQARTFFGCEPEEALVKWTEFITSHPANHAARKLARQAIETGKRQQPYDLELRRRDGRTLWVEVNEAPMLEGERTVAIVGALTDVTDRRRMESLLRIELDLGMALGAVRTARDAYRHTVEAALRVKEVDAGGLYLVDATSGDLTLTCRRGVSEEFAKALGTIPAMAPRGKLVRRTSGRGLEVEDEFARREGLRASMVFPIRHEGRLLACLNLASRQVDTFPPVAVNALRTIANQLGPILSRFETATSLEKSEATLQTLVESVPAGIGLVRDREFQWMNEHMTRMTGYPLRDLLGQNARILYVDDSEFKRVGRAMFDRIQQTGIGSMEARWRRRDGTLLDVLLSAAALDRDNLATGTVFTAWDITKRNRAEEQRRELESQVQQAQKLESLGVLAGGIAHDFNNILHAILGHANLASSRLPAGDHTAYHLVEIERAASRAGGLCRQMLAYSGRGSFLIQRVSLGEIVRDLADILEVSLSKKAELCVDLASDVPPIEADASQLRQVVMNLITNAAEAIGNRTGVVRATVASAYYDEDRLTVEFRNSGLAAGKYVVLTVEDTGCGMDAETRERIFEPFFTTKFTGRGLGLAAIQGIVRAHRGGIRVVSEPGHGTSITVLLPPAVGEARPLLGVKAPAPALEAQGTILLADDDPRLLEIGRLMLEGAGFSVVAVEDGQCAIDAFKERPDAIQCAILDLTMPVMDGVETFHALREMRPEVPVILCSGYSSQELRSHFDTERPAGFLEKPFTSDSLLGLLAQVLPSQRLSPTRPA